MMASSVEPLLTNSPHPMTPRRAAQLKVAAMDTSLATMDVTRSPAAPLGDSPQGGLPGVLRKRRSMAEIQRRESSEQLVDPDKARGGECSGAQRDDLTFRSREIHEPEWSLSPFPASVVGTFSCHGVEPSHTTQRPRLFTPPHPFALLLPPLEGDELSFFFLFGSPRGAKKGRRLGTPKCVVSPARPRDAFVLFVARISWRAPRRRLTKIGGASSSRTAPLPRCFLETIAAARVLGWVGVQGGGASSSWSRVERWGSFM